MDSVDRCLLPPLPQITDSQRAVLRSLVEDSLGFRFVKRGDTTTIVAVTPRARAISAHFEKGVQTLGNLLITGLTLLALIYLPIPVWLLGVTAIWLWQRRRFSRDFIRS